MTTPRTVWVQPKPPRAKPEKIGKVDMDALQITDDKPVPTRLPVGNKYEHIFKAIKPGQAIKCRSEDTARVSVALRKWILDNLDASKFTVKMVSKYPDGMGRVWLAVKPARL